MLIDPLKLELKLKQLEACLTRERAFHAN